MKPAPTALKGVEQSGEIRLASCSTFFSMTVMCVRFAHKSQCAPSVFNLDQKFHGLSCFWGIDIHETGQNQSRKTSVIRLPKFISVNMVRKCHHRASFSIENLFLEDYSFANLMTDVFLE